MKSIQRQIDHLEAMLAADELQKKDKPRRFTASEVEAIKQIIEVVKTVDTLLWAMDRPTSDDD
jgi:prophage DNA circulation protein